jgi:hypothetical protein
MPSGGSLATPNLRFGSLTLLLPLAAVSETLDEDSTVLDSSADTSNASKKNLSPFLRTRHPSLRMDSEIFRYPMTMNQNQTPLAKPCRTPTKQKL